MAKKKVSVHERAFLDAILDAPDDDGPRLIYADWLEDNDLPHRGEFIRLQCRLATMQEYDPERLPLEQREADLLCVHEREWAEALPTVARPGYRGAYRRGFVEQASLTATDFLKRGAGLFAATPVSVLQIRNLRGKMPQVADSPLLARAPGLDFDESRLTPEDLRTLGASPHLGNLRELTLSWTDLTREHAETLAGWPTLPRMRSLTLRAKSAEALGALTRSRRLTSLRRLSWTGLADPAGFRGLADAAPALEHLEVYQREVSDEEMAALGGHPSLASLRVNANGSIVLLGDTASRLSSLDLITAWRLSSEELAGASRLRRLSAFGTSVHDEDAGRLASSARLAGLVRLDLRRAYLYADGVRLLATSPHLAGLRRLDLSMNEIGDDGAAALAESPHLRGLTYLDLGDCEIGSRGAAALAASPNLARLRHLNLSGNAVRAKGAAALAGSEHLGELRVLDLTAAEVGVQGVRALARSKGLGNLRHLALCNNEVPDVKAVLPEFADPSRLPALLSLALEPGGRDTRQLVELGRPLLL
jgi:uncharacterized protein (TIGR02996 family)